MPATTGFKHTERQLIGHGWSGLCWIEDLEWSFKANSVNGQLQVWDGEGRLLGRGIPAYQVSEAEKVDEPSLKLGEDVNGDGLRDWVFRSGTRSQVIYNLGL